MAKGTISIPAAAVPYCNAVAGDCTAPVVAKVVTVHDHVLYTTLMCRTHLDPYIEGMINGRSVNVVGIFPIDPAGER
jgi:hypothetical protein